jgi:O-antigen ligase
MLTLFYKKNKIDFITAISLLCAALVPLLVTGPFLPDLIVSSLSLWFLYFSLKHKMYYIYRNFYFYFFIAFCLVCILSSLFSENIFFSLKSSLFYFRIGIFAMLISYLINQNKKILDYFYYAFILTFSALIIDGYIQHFTGSNLFGNKIDGIRISSFFGDEYILGSYLARLFPLLFALFVVRKNKHTLEAYGISILFILIDVLIFLAGERASFVFLNISTIFIVLFISKYKLLRIFLLIISLIIIALLTLNDSRLYDRYIQSPIQTMGLNTSKKFLFTPTHDFLIKTSWSMFLEKPILGHGPKSFRYKCKNPVNAAETDVYCHIHPHNFYAQLLAETGIVGFSFLAWLFFYFIYLTMRNVVEYFKYKKQLLSDYQICLLSGLLITIWPITTNGNIFNNHLMLFYSLQMGFFRRI